jgi:acyl-coenzyme A thioesterase PaaI-like protein
VTDVSMTGTPLPSRLGISARYEDEQLTFEVRPQPETLHHGMIRASVLALVIDIVAGMPLDREDDMWTLTSDMTVRMRPLPAPLRIDATSEVVRRGRRSATSLVELRTDEGLPIGTGAIGFAKVPRKPTDPPKPRVPLDQVAVVFQDLPRLERPLRIEAGIEVIDPAEGTVRVELTPELLNPAGTLQGAMVALVAEAAAEDLLETTFGSPFVVIDLDLRYLRRTEQGPIRSRTTLLGDRPDSAVQIELIDDSINEITTLVYARAVAVP